MSVLNIELADGNKIVSYEDDSYHYDGCPTCDFGSEYINEITICTTNHTIRIVFNQMYEYAFSMAEAIRIFATDLKGMTEEEFIKYIDSEFHKFDGLKKFEIE